MYLKYSTLNENKNIVSGMRRRGKTDCVLTFKVLDALMFSGMFSSGWIVPFDAQPLAFGTLHFTVVANSA
jgi:hypothetical protein